MKVPKSKLFLLASLVLSLATPAAYAQYATGGYTITNTNPPPCWLIPIEYEFPPSPMTPTSVNPTPAPTLIFNGLSDDDTCIPPIPNIAVGPAHVMTMLSSHVQITDRTGTNVLSTVTTPDWWSNHVSGAPLQKGDVRLLYDPYSSRWVAVGDNGPNLPSYVMVAVSQTSDPTSNWYGFKYVADPGGTNYADYPMVGFNKDKFVVAFNSITLATYHGTGVGFLILDKTNLYGGVSTTQFIYKPGAEVGYCRLFNFACSDIRPNDHEFVYG
jgi:hypothetical protein